MKLIMLAALAVAAPVAAFAQTAPAADPAMQQPAPGADATTAAPAPAADPAAAAPAAPMQMGAPAANPAPAAQDSYPVCSASVTDQCREGAGGKHMGKHKMMHRTHKK